MHTLKVFFFCYRPRSRSYKKLLWVRLFRCVKCLDNINEVFYQNWNCWQNGELTYLPVDKMASWQRVRLKQHICFPLFERLFCWISVLRVTSRRGGWVRWGGCYNTLAERYGERIRCFTLTRWQICQLTKWHSHKGKDYCEFFDRQTFQSKKYVVMVQNILACKVEHWLAIYYIIFIVLYLLSCNYFIDLVGCHSQFKSLRVSLFTSAGNPCRRGRVSKVGLFILMRGNQLQVSAPPPRWQHWSQLCFSTFI